MANNEKALNAFIGKRAQVEAQLKALLTYVEDHCDTLPEDINYAHCGDMDYTSSKLAEICEFLNVEVK